MGYARGATVVHPQHGAAIVVGMLFKDVAGEPAEYLELLVEHAGLKIMVPAASVAELGIRDVCTKQEAETILALLADEPDVPERWAERNAVTLARMRSASLRDHAMVVRDLTRHAARIGKPLSASEKASLDACAALLRRELSLSLELSEEQTMALIMESISRPLPAAVPSPL